MRNPQTDRQSRQQTGGADALATVVLDQTLETHTGPTPCAGCGLVVRMRVINSATGGPIVISPVY
jgi:hypothetical protein